VFRHAESNGHTSPLFSGLAYGSTATSDLREEREYSSNKHHRSTGDGSTHGSVGLVDGNLGNSAWRGPAGEARRANGVQFAGDVVLADNGREVRAEGDVGRLDASGAGDVCWDRGKAGCLCEDTHVVGERKGSQKVLNVGQSLGNTKLVSGVVFEACDLPGSRVVGGHRRLDRRRGDRHGQSTEGVVDIRQTSRREVVHNCGQVGG